jgi:hypothetical protein
MSIPTQSDWWGETRKALALEKDLSKFKIWDTVRLVPLYNDLASSFTMQVSMLSELFSRNPEMKKRWLPILIAGESKIGHTDESWEKVQRKISIPETITVTPWIVQAVNHAVRFEIAMGKRITDYENVIEFGAGIGQFAKIILDNSTGVNYSIYDFPEVQRISNFYLDKRASMLADICEIESRRSTLFIGTWSLSEAPPEFRALVAEKVRGCDQFIAFQTKIWEYDNLGYFVWKYPALTNTFVRLEPWIDGYQDGQGTNVYMFGKGR